MPRRATPEVNAGSMADIAFLLLIFFLMSTTMATDSGLARLLPPPIPPNQEEDKSPPVKERNVFTVLINSKNQLLVEGEYIDVKQLRQKAKEFIENPSNLDHLPEKKDTEVPFFGQYPVSKGIVSLQNDRGTQYQAYIRVQNELQAAYNELREDIARKKWSTSYANLDDERQKAIKEIYPQRISEAEPKNIGGGR